jgi:hypothetical protein
MKIQLTYRDQLTILTYRGNDKEILKLQAEVRTDWEKYLINKLKEQQ